METETMIVLMIFSTVCGLFIYDKYKEYKRSKAINDFLTGFLISTYGALGIISLLEKNHTTLNIPIESIPIISNNNDNDNNNNNDNNNG